MIHHDIPVRPWDMIGTDRLTLNNKHYLCIEDYHSKFPIIKKTYLSADSLILTCNFISDKFKIFCKTLNIEQAFSSSYHHQSNGQVEVLREDQNLCRWIKEALFIRVNNPSLNKNIGKYHLPHIWDEVLHNTSELKLK